MNEFGFKIASTFLVIDCTSFKTFYDLNLGQNVKPIMFTASI